MQRLEERFEVRGVTPQACFDYIVDPDNGADWFRIANDVVAHGPPGPGRTIEARIGFLGISFGVRTEATTWVEPTNYCLTGSVPFHTELGADFSETADGTAVDAFLALDPGRFFPVPGVVLRKALKLEFDRDVKALRTQLRRLA